MQKQWQANGIKMKFIKKIYFNKKLCSIGIWHFYKRNKYVSFVKYIQTNCLESVLDTYKAEIYLNFCYIGDRYVSQSNSFQWSKI